MNILSHVDIRIEHHGIVMAGPPPRFANDDANHLATGRGSAASGHAPDRRPLMTFAIPTFNRAQLLEEWLQSCFAQTYEDYEILVSDNASADATPAVLARFCDPRLRVIRQTENIGLLPNWNACLAAARGHYIIFVSDDDRIAPGLLARCAQLIATDPGLPAIVTLSDLYAREFGRLRPARTSRAFDTGIHDGVKILSAFLSDEITVNMCGVVMKTDLLRAHGGIPLDFPHTADVAAWAPLLLLGDAGFVNEACATYSYCRNSETARLGVEQLLSDGWRTASLISRCAGERIGDPSKRSMIQEQSRRFFARRALVALSAFRNNGETIDSILSHAWRFRRFLKGVNARSVLRFSALVACPRFLTHRIRQIRYGAPQSSA